MKDPAAMMALHLGVGAAILLFGRRLFWMFLSGTGFVVGALAATRLLEGQSDVVILTVAVVAGVVGALLALFAQKIAVAVAGALAGGYLLDALSTHLPPDIPPWAGILAGAILGAILLTFLFDWALIALSSLTGAAVISQNIPVAPPWPSLIFVGLLLIGIVLQTRQFLGKRRRKSNDDD